MTLLKPAVCRNGRFQNPVPTSVGSLSFLPRIIGKALSNRAETVPRKPLGPFHTDTSIYSHPPQSGLRITWMGHSTLLIEIDGTTVLLDPVWSERASFVQWFGPKRFYAPPISIADLPPLDAVLLSHDHYDHLDAAALSLLMERTPVFICSLGVGKHLLRWGIPAHKIREINWMDSLPAASGLTVTALPARHFSGRSLKRFGTLWSSFVLEGAQHRIYCGADSGYFGGFAEIGKHFAARPYGDGASNAAFDLAMLEIGAYDPLWEDIHMGPDNAAKAFHDLRAKTLMPIHWGLFNLALHAWDQPIERIVTLAAQEHIPLFLPQPGTPAQIDTSVQPGPPSQPANLEAFWWRRFQS